MLAGTLRASVRLLSRQSAGVDLAEAFRRLGFAPASGFGASLGAALAGLSGDAFEILQGNATRLSLLAPVESRERRGRAWRLHPLLAEVLRTESGDAEREATQQRSTEWFLARLPEEKQGPAWQELGEETEALAAWLAAVPAEDRVRVERAGSWYAMNNGPFHAWRAFCEQALDGALEAADRSHFLWTLGQVARKAGALEQALTAATEKEELDRTRGEERGAALAASLRADVLQAWGELDEALRIRREEELPVYERLDDVREQALALGKIADVLEARGELDEALRIRREEELPVYERLGDVRSRAVTLGQIADVLQARGELDEALRIRREEELPVFERLGDVRERAVILGKIADALQTRGELEEALRIYLEECCRSSNAWLEDVRCWCATRTSPCSSSSAALRAIGRRQPGYCGLLWRLPRTWGSRRRSRSSGSSTTVTWTLRRHPLCLEKWRGRRFGGRHDRLGSPSGRATCTGFRSFSPHPLDSRLCYSLRTGEGLTFPVTSEAGPPEVLTLRRPLTR